MLDETFVYPVGDPNPCPFEVTYRNQGTFFVTTFVDANGNTIRELDRGAYFLESYPGTMKWRWLPVSTAVFVAGSVRSRRTAQRMALRRARALV
jgi:hypothetical protein